MKKILLIAALMAGLVTPALAATKVSDLPTMSALAGTELLTGVQSGDNKNATPSLLATYMASNLIFTNTTLRALDTNASHSLVFKPGSDLTANRTFTITTGDANRTLDISAADTTVSAFGATLVDDAAATNARTTLGLAIGTNVQAWDADLDTWATKTAPSGTVVGTSDTQTLTAKTLTAPIISTISNTGTLTLPTSTDTLVGRATTDTLTNKTLTSPTLTTPVITGPVTTTSTTTPQRTLAYDGSNKLDESVSSAGAVTWDATGASAGFTFSDPITSVANYVNIANGAGAPSAAGIGSTTSSTMSFYTSGSRRGIVTGGNLNWGGGSSVFTGSGGVVANFQSYATGTAAGAGFARASANSNGPYIHFGKNRNAAVSADTIVNSADELGSIFFDGNNGSGYDAGAVIVVTVDGTPGASADMPGKFDFKTSADGSATPTSRMTINAAGVVNITGSLTLGTDLAIAEGGTGASTAAAARTNLGFRATEYCWAASDFNTTPLIAATSQAIEYLPAAFTVTGVRAYTRTAPTGLLTIDINEAGSTILSTKLTIDSTEKTSGTAAAAAVISDSSIAANAEITVDIDSTTGGKGLVVCMEGTF